ncbi:bifunctional DNA primase/polymerase [Bradyrhizobium daqingense]|uniref:Bifunctional DNA primase/polymerase-like protein n=1 Tax=Bradyrhizobium daqingense TaxID=993502 RepID=A0A562K893_9BRAD|nr:bifunctional DNA primase/polymerase [Bradyrhizobium daqingense]TWH91661.1 bifunctional DNA primase/polymerase-like protein [Bradyrhizobium daqingense]
MRATLKRIIHLRCSLIAYGYRPVACSGKAAVMGNWQRSRWSAAQMEGIARNYPDATNTGLLCGELVGLDVDTPDAETADAIRAMVMELPGSDRAPYRMGKAPKTLFAFRATEPREKRATGAYLINGAKCQVEAFGERTQFVAFGTHPDTGRPYEWFNGSPAETPLAELPEITPEAIDELLARAEAYFAERGTLIKPASKASDRGPVVVDSDHPWADTSTPRVG